MMKCASISQLGVHLIDMMLALSLATAAGSRSLSLSHRPAQPPPALAHLRMNLDYESPSPEDLSDNDPDDLAPPSPPAFNIKAMSGIVEPLGFFDPAGFSKEASEGRIKFYREVELKHGRIAMLAALGFPIAEQFHPLFGGDVDVRARRA